MPSSAHYFKHLRLILALMGILLWKAVDFGPTLGIVVFKRGTEAPPLNNAIHIQVCHSFCQQWGITQAVNDGQWHHIALTRSGLTVKAYLDGQDKTIVFTNPAVIDGDSNQPLLFGKGTSPTEYFFNGQLDEIEIFNRALTPAEVTAIYAAGSAGKCKAAELPPCQTDLAQANQTIQNLQGQIAQLQNQVSQLQTQLSQAQQQNTQLQNQITQLNATVSNLQNQVTSLTAQNAQLQNQVSTLTQQRNQLQNQLNQVNTTLNNGLTAIQTDFRRVFSSPNFTIPGSTPSQKFQNLVNAILGLNHGRKEGLFVNLGGKPGHNH